MPLERTGLAVELAAAFARRLDPNAVLDASPAIARVADAAAALGVAGDDRAFLDVVARRVMADANDARFTLLPPVAFTPAVFRSSVAVVRESDLLVLRVSWRGASVDGHVLRPDADAGARAALIVELPSQHLMEQAYSAVDGEVPAAPVPVRSAVSSRLAFSLPAGEAVPLTATGVLAAMRRLPPRVVLQARPRDHPWLPPWVIGELVDRLDPDQLVRLDVGEIADRHLAVRRALASLGGIAAVAADPGAAPALGRLAQRAPDVVTVRGDRPQLGRFVPFDAGGIIDILAQIPAEPDDDMTALELPTRLVLSPSPLGGWAHADGPVVAPDGTIERWHTRLGTRIVAADGTVTVDEDNGAQRIVRAVWTRDVRDGETWPDAPADGDWESVLMDRKPFRSSLLPTHRWQIVRNSLIREGNRPAPPVDADALSLTPLGAWTDLHGRWNPDTGDVVAWDHRMAGGRDDFVRVVQRGYFAPCGFRAVWITETWREVTATKGMRGLAAPLRQRQYPVFQDTVRRFTGGVTRENPYIEVRVLQTRGPDLRSRPPGPSFVPTQQDDSPWLVPVVGVDADGNEHPLPMPMLFVTIGDNTSVASTPHPQAAAALAPYGAQPTATGFQLIAGTDQLGTRPGGRRIAYAPRNAVGDMAHDTTTQRFAARLRVRDCDPVLVCADLVVPAAAALTGRRDPLRVTYHPGYAAAASLLVRSSWP